MKKTLFLYYSRKSFCLFITMLLSGYMLSAYAQNNDKVKVSGTVTDSQNEPLIGASVIEKGTTNGCLTDINGRFELHLLPEAALEVSYLGFVKQQISINGRPVINVQLKENAILLGDVVAIGYAIGSKRSISGAVQKIGKEDMNTGVVNTPLDAIQGRAAGVNVQTTSSDPTVGPTVRIRGTTSLSGGNDPLVVIDGVMGNLNVLNTLSVADIESFTILKDASETAQYGSRGAGGVIVVTTQKGKYGMKSLSYDGSFGVQSVAKRTHSLTADEYRQAANSRGLSFIDGGYNTDFMDEILQAGYTQNHKLSFGKGDEDSNYNVSLGIIDQKGIVETTAQQRYNLKINVSQSFFDNKLKLESGAFGSVMKARSLYDTRKTFYGAVTMNPTFPNTPNEDGTWPRDPVASEVYNPLDMLTTQMRNKRYDATVHARATWTIVEGLKFSAFGSFTLNDDEASVYLPIKSRLGMRANGGRAEKSNGKNENYLGNLSLSYIKTAGKHSLNALGLVEGQEYKYHYFSAASSKYSSDYHGPDNLGGGAIINYGDVSSSRSSFKLISFLGRVNYVYDNKYIATINMRTDGSSKLGKNNKWGFFPSFSLAWDIANESFMKENAGFVHSLKLRASYGITGNQDAISPYNSLQLLGANSGSLVTVDGNPVIAYAYLRNANPDLKWETKKTLDIGFDFSVLNDRLSFVFDYYNAKTDDLLYTYSVPQPPFIYDRLLANIGSMTNKGLELSVNYAVVRTKDIGLDVSANVSYQKNKVTSLTGTYKGQSLTPSAYVKLSRVTGAGVQGNTGVVYMFEGQPLGVFYLPKTDGLKEVDGKNKYHILDIDGKEGVSVSDGKDRYIAGQAMPKCYLGTSIKFRYKAFDIQTQLNGAFGHKIYNGTAMTLNNMNNFPGYNLLKGAPEKNIYDNTITDYWLESGNYLNIAYVTLGYNLNTGKNKSGVKLIRFTASVNNLHTFTGYSGLTPMINSVNLDSNNHTFGNDDKRFYPVARTFSLGVSVHF